MEELKSYLWTDSFILYLKLFLEPRHLLANGGLMQLAGDDP